jgi:hypothetical protein
MVQDGGLCQHLMKLHVQLLMLQRYNQMAPELGFTFSAQEEFEVNLSLIHCR